MDDVIVNIELSKEELTSYAAILGSDCPFFIDNTSKMVFGRGEIMEDLASTGI